MILLLKPRGVEAQISDTSIMVVKVEERDIFDNYVESFNLKIKLVNQYYSKRQKGSLIIKFPIGFTFRSSLFSLGNEGPYDQISFADAMGGDLKVNYYLPSSKFALDAGIYGSLSMNTERGSYEYFFGGQYNMLSYRSAVERRFVLRGYNFRNYNWSKTHLAANNELNFQAGVLRYYPRISCYTTWVGEYGLEISSQHYKWKANQLYFGLNYTRKIYTRAIVSKYYTDPKYALKWKEHPGRYSMIDMYAHFIASQGSFLVDYIDNIDDEERSEYLSANYYDVGFKAGIGGSAGGTGFHFMGRISFEVGLVPIGDAHLFYFGGGLGCTIM